MNYERDNDDVQEVLDSHDQELTIDEHIEIETDIEKLESLDPIQPEDRMMVGNLTEGDSSVEKGLRTLENIDSKEERIFSTKQGIKYY
ncbi:tigger transposable element-derived protein 1 [Trichonephila clavipes]|nr:tigger transposable element-derived protein 1 [Trichonephila clavipes]